jgi:hypothetical protein
MLGVLEMLAGQPASAQPHLEAYWQKGPQSLADIAELIDKSPELRTVFARAGLSVANGRFGLAP